MLIYLFGQYLRNFISTKFSQQILVGNVIGSNLHITEIVFLFTGNNLLLRIYCENIVNIAFFAIFFLVQSLTDQNFGEVKIYF